MWPAVLPAYPSLLELAVLGLATWRLSHMLVWEIGFGGVLHWIRVHTGIVYRLDASGEVYSEPNSYNPLWCVYCTSVYAVIIMLLLGLLGGTVGQLVVLGLALSGLVCLIERWHDSGTS